VGGLFCEQEEVFVRGFLFVQRKLLWQFMALFISCYQLLSAFISCYFIPKLFISFLTAVLSAVF
jgi:hypothetical protein